MTTVVCTRCTEERDEPDPDGDREVIVQQPEQVEPTAESKWHGKQNVRRFKERAIGQIKKDVDDADGDWHYELQPLLCPDFVLELPAPTVVVAGRHFHLCADGFVRIGDNAAGVPAARIHQHGDFEQAVLAVDLSWSGNLMDVCNLSQWNLCAISRCDENVGYICGIAPEFWCIADAHREALPPFDGGG